MESVPDTAMKLPKSRTVCCYPNPCKKMVLPKLNRSLPQYGVTEIKQIITAIWCYQKLDKKCYASVFGLLNGNKSWENYEITKNLTKNATTLSLNSKSVNHSNIL